MKLPSPIRKIPREIMRIAYQIDNAILLLFGATVGSTYCRYFIDPQTRCVPGQVTRGDRVAIYLMFPRHGLLKSHLSALDYIIRCGYTPLVVSNLPLGEKDAAQVQKKCAALILRRNFGYDFAGYQQAIRWLGKDLRDLQYLALFNDSSWFPAHPNVNWLAEAEAKSLDFVGSVSHGGIDVGASFAHDDGAWTVDRSRPRFHYGSFSLLFGKEILRSPGFAHYWQTYCPSNSKRDTIKRGEIGLSQWVIANGYSHGETLDSSHLPELLGRQPIDRLLEIARNAISFDRPRPNDTRRNVLDAKPYDHKAIRDYVLHEVLKTGQGYALQDFDIRSRGGIFIKKLPVSMSREAARQTLRIMDHLDGPDVDIFRAEALGILKQKHGDPG